MTPSPRILALMLLLSALIAAMPALAETYSDDLLEKEPVARRGFAVEKLMQDGEGDTGYRKVAPMNIPITAADVVPSRHPVKREKAASGGGKKAKTAAKTARAARSGPSCDFAAWTGKPVMIRKIKAAGRPYRIIEPGRANFTRDFKAERINVYVNNDGFVTDVECW